MCEMAARKMLALVKGCHLFPNTEAKFTRLAAAHNCDEMWQYFLHCVKDRPDVGVVMQRSGRKPLESVRREMESLYEQHRKNVRLDDIVAYLNAAQVRATYGAVAQVVGGIAQSIGERLGGVAGRRPEASWVVNSETGMPTGFLPEHLHPALLKNRDVITSGEDLVRRVSEWKVGDAPSRPTTVGPSVSSAPVLRKRSVPEPPCHPTPAPTLSVDDLGDLRRKLMALLDRFDTAKSGPGEGIGTRISRLSHDGGPVPRHIAALMKTITEMRNSAEYESKVLSASECAVVRHAWQAIQEWVQTVRRT